MAGNRARQRVAEVLAPALQLLPERIGDRYRYPDGS